MSATVIESPAISEDVRAQMRAYMASFCACDVCRGGREPTGRERAQVARGVAWLDKDRPGWRDAVTDLKNFDIADAGNCILAQVYRDEGGYTAHYPRAELETGRPVNELGFAGMSKALNVVWCEAIHASAVRA